MDTSGLTIIEKYPADPVDMFLDILSHVPEGTLKTMNLATVDSELGTLNRTVVYRGLTERAITFVTQRNTRKYSNLKENPKLSLTLYFPDLAISTEDHPVTWQIRLFDATAIELSAEQTKSLWQQECLFAKIRTHICECGAPVDPAELKIQHDKLLKEAESGNDLPQPETYCAFAVQTKCWDFYKGEPFKIADRVQYRRDNNADAWQEKSGLTIIENYPEDPVNMFRDILNSIPEGTFITMNLATIDSELGIHNRTVVYRGLTDEAVTFATQRNSRIYSNLKENTKLALTFYSSNLATSSEEQPITWQIRLFDATAVELSVEQTKNLWQQEPLYCKIRTHISACGAPIDPAELKLKHDNLLQEVQNGLSLSQPENYCAFAVIPKRWDFFKAEPYKIADRIQYRRENNAHAWQVMHIAA